MSIGQITVTLTFRTDIQTAPVGKVCLAWGAGGWRFMKKDDMGQWRSMLGLPKAAPRWWAEAPAEALRAAK
ncbi:hypothetical protein [Aestuariivirga litoralis]|uniref:hypothetical protein n=1 Tax=Aestuariivirga litoralis TaxID=2650924 RepID=UPI0018C76D82|nr:hypothetical protein [Aestuariivirga litoralis]MBG1233003.1 hypothetical protein [Aestuariivirga litoralis]